MLQAFPCALLASSFPVAVPANDSRLLLEGRWSVTGTTAIADWPCSTLRFRIGASVAGASAVIVWSGLRERLAATVTNELTGQVVRHDTLSAHVLVDSTYRSLITLPSAGNFGFELRKMTQGEPFGMGPGRVLGSSTLTLFGLDRFTRSELLPAARRTRLIEAVGASDTAGFCISGTPEIPPAVAELSAWRYDDCARSNAARQSDAFGAELSVVAMAGGGLTQNAPGVGSLTLPQLYARTLQATPQPRWSPSRAADLVLVSLGGNDFNHHAGAVPSNTSFAEAFANFTLAVFQEHGDRVENGNSTAVVHI